MEIRSYRGKVVTVTKKSRGRFPKEVALPGDQGLVISTWYSSMGTPKLTMLLQDGTVRCTTLNCVLIEDQIPDLDHNEKLAWESVKKEYDEKNSIPVIAVCLNVGKKAYRLKSLNNKIFFYRHEAPPGTKPAHKVGDCFTVSIPIWLAKKEGIIPN